MAKVEVSPRLALEPEALLPRQGLGRARGVGRPLARVDEDHERAFPPCPGHLDVGQHRPTPSRRGLASRGPAALAEGVHGARRKSQKARPAGGRLSGALWPRRRSARPAGAPVRGSPTVRLGGARHGSAAASMYLPPVSSTWPVTARRMSACTTSCLSCRPASASTIAGLERGTPSANSSTIAGATRSI